METGASKFNGEIRINRWIWGMEDSLQNFGPLSSEGESGMLNLLFWWESIFQLDTKEVCCQ
jgi:hypothetical protein